jgi:hypothetical protein
MHVIYTDATSKNGYVFCYSVVKQKRFLAKMRNSLASIVSDLTDRVGARDATRRIQRYFEFRFALIRLAGWRAAPACAEGFQR